VRITPERLLTKEEVAEWLGLARRGIDTLTAGGRLPVIRLSSRCVRYDPDDIRRQLWRCRTRNQIPEKEQAD